MKIFSLSWVEIRDEKNSIRIKTFIQFIEIFINQINYGIISPFLSKPKEINSKQILIWILKSRNKS